MQEATTTRGGTPETGLLMALRAGDDSAFLALVKQHHAGMLRLARTYVPSAGVAEDVVQEAWIGVLKGLSGFEGRSSVRTWIFRIVANIGKTRGAVEARTTPFPSDTDGEDGKPAVDPDRFRGPGHPRWPGSWLRAPQRWADEQLIGEETLARILEGIETLPVRQRQVITLRDVEGLEGDEVCVALGISGANQRVLLHRARSTIRTLLEEYLAAGRGGS